VARLEEVVATLSVRTEAVTSGTSDLEERLDVALQRATDAEAALDALRASASGDHAELLRRASQEQEAMAAQVADRDGRISRLQREVGDKTERLGRLAKELGELKAKGLGKIFR
jgi:chromosome segregation ATPase